MGLPLIVDAVSADVLGDAARLAGCDVRVADIVEQGGLAVVNVTHNDDDRGTGDQLALRCPHGRR